MKKDIVFKDSVVYLLFKLCSNLKNLEYIFIFNIGGILS